MKYEKWSVTTPFITGQKFHCKQTYVGDIKNSSYFINDNNQRCFNICCIGTTNTWPKEKELEASNKLRQLSALLNSKTCLVPFYNILGKAKIVKSRSIINKVKENLIYLSNSTPKSKLQNISEITLASEEIKRLLGLI